MTKKLRGGARKRALPEDDYCNTRHHSDAQNALCERVDKINKNNNHKLRINVSQKLFYFT
jgi:hypothetical protein